MIAIPPLRIDQNGLYILSVVLQADLLHLLDLDYFLEPVEIFRVFVELAIPKLLLIALFLLSDHSFGLRVGLLLVTTKPAS